MLKTRAEYQKPERSAISRRETPKSAAEVVQTTADELFTRAESNFRQRRAKNQRGKPLNPVKCHSAAVGSIPRPNKPSPLGFSHNPFQ